MSDIEEGLLQLACKQRRLEYWHKMLGPRERLQGEESQVDNLLNTYCLLMVKYVKSGKHEERADAAERLWEIERQMESLFDSSRLITSKNGALSIRHLSIDWSR